MRTARTSARFPAAPRGLPRLAQARQAALRLALLAGVLLFAVQPAVLAGHHHGPGHDHDASCPVCVWQAHHAADVPAGASVGASAPSALAPLPADESGAAAAPTAHPARAPPGSCC